jgi:hypothetical protein
MPLVPQGTNMQGGMMAGGEMNNQGGNMQGTNQQGVEGAVNCGATSCDLSANVCCVGFGGQTCEAGNTCAFSASQICDGSEDCGLNQVCCMGFGGFSFSCALNQCGNLETQLCTSQDQCTDGQICRTCVYPANVRISSCGNAGTIPSGAFSCE